MSTEMKPLEETIETSSIKQDDAFAGENDPLGPPSYTVEEENKGESTHRLPPYLGLTTLYSPEKDGHIYAAVAMLHEYLRLSG